ARGEPGAEQVVVGVRGRDPPLERGAARAREPHVLPQLGPLADVGGKVAASPVIHNEALEFGEHRGSFAFVIVRKHGRAWTRSHRGRVGRGGAARYQIMRK